MFPCSSQGHVVFAEYLSQFISDFNVLNFIRRVSSRAFERINVKSFTTDIHQVILKIRKHHDD